MSRRFFAVLFTTLAAVGLAGLISYLGVIVAVRTTDVDPPEGNLGWLLIGAGVYGGMAAIFFGALALALRSDR